MKSNQLLDFRADLYYIKKTMRTSKTTIRVRYFDTDQMGTFKNSSALDWFEIGRTEFLRESGTPYSQWEDKGVMLPLVESYVQYLSRAKYDDELIITVSAAMVGKARIRFDLEIAHSESDKLAAAGHTIHAFTDPAGKPIRPPKWVLEIVNAE